MSLDNIEYSFYNYRVTWEEARIICLDYESQLAILDTEEKAIFITHKTSESSLAYEEFWIGSKMHTQGYWIWTGNNNKLIPNKLLKEMIIIPRYTNQSFENDFYCLTIFRRNHNIPMLIPLRCQEQRPFICQKDKLLFEINIVNISSIKVENKNFLLYSAKLTWSEAVVQCRQRGLQIAEVLNSNQAQSLAVGMLRVRPRAIENAWIGGYLKNHVWKWLPTGNNITHNEMWHNESMTDGDCLLLDRHVCKLPTYLSAKCDRRRNFFCQTSVKKELNTNPIAVTLDACRYWIGLYPLNWFEARQYCEKLKATLIVLDSPITINHVLNIMIDNREKLQHIWLDGRRQITHSNSLQKETDSKVWKWESFGKRISGPGESFIPWCNDSQSYDIDADCLNMDREDFNIPIVYGVNCNNEQTYICQQRTTTCDEIKELNEKLLTEKFTTNAEYNILTKKNISIKDENMNNKFRLNSEIIPEYPFKNLNNDNSTEQILIPSIYNNIIFNDSSSIYTGLTEKSIHSLGKLDKFNFTNIISNQLFHGKIGNTVHKNHVTDVFHKLLKNNNKPSILAKIQKNDVTKLPFTPSKIPALNTNLIKLNDNRNKSFDTLSDKDIFLRLFSDKLSNTKYLNKVSNKGNIENITPKSDKKNYNVNYNQSSTSAVMSFREIIEFMVKNININKSKGNIIPLDNSSHLKELKNHTNSEDNTGYQNSTDFKANKTMQTVLVKENISKIVKSSMNKNMHISVANFQSAEISVSKKSPQDKFYANILHKNKLKETLEESEHLKYFVTSIDTDISKGSVSNHHKKRNSLESYNDPNDILKLDHNLRNIYYNNNPIFKTIHDHAVVFNANDNKKDDIVTSIRNKYPNNNKKSYIHPKRLILISEKKS